MGKSPLKEKGGAGEEANKTPTKPKQKKPHRTILYHAWCQLQCGGIAM